MKRLVSRRTGPTMTLEEARAHLARVQTGRRSFAQGAAWEAEILRLAKVKGWLCHHVRPGRTAKGWRSPISGFPGWPDIALAHPRGDLFFVEAKTGAAKPDLNQQVWHAAIRAAGIDCFVLRPEDRDTLVARLG